MFATLFDLATAAPSVPILGYLDPGSGSMALQIAIAGLLSGAYFLRSSWAGVRLWFRRGRAAR